MTSLKLTVGTSSNKDAKKIRAMDALIGLTPAIALSSGTRRAFSGGKKKWRDTGVSGEVRENFG